ncbi:hypothetical protein AJ85_09085 [Alkalihalobacillus alcalophilus ATCC 27647 = CGMCC 1.3604]|uniref:Uncharacterized protein n=1 Tax=Alkalihalobacillus alcalophilus ATCC 27647 = CGMCC 1.3604 TaxID=1218173 RepID=A0A094XJA7_ALKAL|nr:CAP domain-containing protein [Alkalihalobacillus alcalophilus]KGA98830.1 hypothetical protein BALCAV_0201775 [Alkalihalobacillus alcalophilus ATCC 27647 = CGMCC 1.3604]MED1564237.1 CAP domain-containing protein [Alkalihalobacillus alcalophilus]THG90714.1 hypothetical protein AJ85_09085 [Alkalihalobacillus alcalophilus ATCC 27647 = CGMCC 1.3604]
MRKKNLIIVVFVFLFACVAVFEYMYQDKLTEWFPERELLPNTSDEGEELLDEELIEEHEEQKEELASEELDHDDLIIGKTMDEVIEDFGEPDRTDLSAYGYEWLIYAKSDSSYFQIGMEDGKVVTAYFIGDMLEELPYELLDTYDEMNENYHFDEQVSANSTYGQFQFELSPEDKKNRPLIQYADGVWLQIYFDQFTNQLSSLRVLNEDILVRQRPYSVSYRGRLPEPIERSAEEQERIERGEEQQIFDVTNVMRTRHQLEAFVWDQEIAEVAVKHSEDMQKHQFFSHVSPNTGDLSARIQEGGLRPRLAGENIAAHYVDGVAAVEGWLNSEGHRVNLLHEEFTHLGVGVYEDYYTQNFMTPWLP